MKLAQKMMLIPAGRTPIEYSNLSELDQAMTNVINNKNLSPLEKINLYSKLLQKNLKMEEKLKANENPEGKIENPTQQVGQIVKKEPDIKEESFSKTKNDMNAVEAKQPSKRKEKDYHYVKVKKPKQKEKDENMDISSIFNESLTNWESAPPTTKSPSYKTRKNKLNFNFKYPSEDYTNVPFQKNNRQKN